jgi:hypothetical protein
MKITTRRGIIMRRIHMLSRGCFRPFRPMFPNLRQVLTLKSPSNRAFPAAFSGGLQPVDLVGHRAG